MENLSRVLRRIRTKWPKQSLAYQDYYLVAYYTLWNIIHEISEHGFKAGGQRNLLMKLGEVDARIPDPPKSWAETILIALNGNLDRITAIAGGLPADVAIALELRPRFNQATILCVYSRSQTEQLSVRPERIELIAEEEIAEQKSDLATVDKPVYAIWVEKIERYILIDQKDFTLLINGDWSSAPVDLRSAILPDEVAVFEDDFDALCWAQDLGYEPMWPRRYLKRQ